MRSLAAQFRQEVRDRDNAVVETATGQVALAKPGRFRWDYREPFEREIVADGERIWLYEADLEQVTVRPIDDTLGTSPAALLTGSIDVLAAFELLADTVEDDLRWITLGPRSATADFELIQLGFDGKQLNQLRLVDRLGQTTEVQFSDVKRNPEIDPGLFSFTVPPGADVIGESEL